MSDKTEETELLEEEASESVAPVTATNGHSDSPSLLDNLRKARKEIGTDKYLDLEIPGYNGELVARYHRLDWDVLRAIARKAEKSKNPRKELNAQCDVLIAACEQILIRHQGVLKPLNVAFPELGEEPVRYDNRLTKALDFEAPNARGAVFGTFSNDLAVTYQHNELSSWMGESSQDEDEDFSQES
jgi:hypothetical protein